MNENNQQYTCYEYFGNGTLKCDHINRLITLTSDYIKRLSLDFVTIFARIYKDFTG